MLCEGWLGVEGTYIRLLAEGMKMSAEGLGFWR